VGIRAALLLFNAAIKHAEAVRRNFEAANATPEEIVEEAVSVTDPLLKFVKSVPDSEFRERFAGRYGSGGPLDYFYELAEIIWEHDKNFEPDGLTEYRASKDDQRIKEAESTIKFIENRITEIIVGYFKKIHGNNYWTYMGTKETRVKA